MIVLDSSALLAFLWDEPGGKAVEAALATGDAVCTVVNWSEVAAKVLAKDGDWTAAETALYGLGLVIAQITADDAISAARMWLKYPSLSLGDRLCLAVALRQQCTVMTADRMWAAVTGLVQLVRH